MGVYISNMEMPKAGAYICELGVLDENTAVLTINTPIDEPQKSYTLVPVPQHGRLIDEESICGQLRPLIENPYCYNRLQIISETLAHCLQIISDVPTIIPAEEGE